VGCLLNFLLYDGILFSVCIYTAEFNIPSGFLHRVDSESKKEIRQVTFSAEQRQNLELL
jgi:hypothetical protein